MTRDRIILFNPQPDPEEFYAGAPLNLLSICKLLPRDEFDLKIFQARPGKKELTEILALAEDSLCMGISCLTGYQIKDGLKVAARVKRKNPRLHLIWGGWHPTLFPEQTIASNLVDLVIQGQGEITFAEVANRLRQRRSLEGVPGLGFRKDGRVSWGPPRPLENINTFPDMPYDLVDLNRYLEQTPYGKRVLSYISSFGCPYQCRFCSEINMSKGHWFGLEPQRMLDEIARLTARYRLDGIIFHDNNFFGSSRRMQEICEGLLKRQIGIKWGRVNGRTDQLLKFGPRLWDLMKKSGCSSLLIGAESGNQSVLEFLEKDTRVEETLAVAAHCKRLEIQLIYSFMIGLSFGIQGLTIKRELEETLSLIRKLLEVNVNAELMLFIYTPYPGTPLYETCVNAGFSPPQSLQEWSHFNLHSQKLPWVPKKYWRIVDQLSGRKGAIFTFIYWIHNDRRKRANPLYRLVYRLGLWRIRKNFFHLPLDYYLIKFVALTKSNLENMFHYLPFT